jgi:nucleotide-binding universal stress UspA family protein
MLKVRLILGNIMYQTIVLAFDGSKEGWLALREGAELALTAKAKVVAIISVLKISASQPFGPGLFPIEGVGGDGVTESQKLLEEAAEEIQSLGIPNVQRYLAFGEPVEQLADLTTKIDADLVVVGHRHRSTLDRWWQGSVSKSLIDTVDCSVLIAMPKTPSSN